mmetsp:Transcript_21229/g.42517  ORF Transcript_21229/g.42517 Transcript_21229/m.42517 type:complete len:231 (+) Transcript_21229:63-755(+)
MIFSSIGRHAPGRYDGRAKSLLQCLMGIPILQSVQTVSSFQPVAPFHHRLQTGDSIIRSELLRPHHCDSCTVRLSSGVGDPLRQLPGPKLDLSPLDVVSTVMESLRNVNEPYPNAGLEVNFDFSSDRCRASVGGDLKAFVAYARNPTFSAMIGKSKVWSLSGKEPVGNIIPGTNTRGDMVTVLVEVRAHPETTDLRHFLWTLQKERRPPRQGMWLIHECIYVENIFEKTL